MLENYKAKKLIHVLMVQSDIQTKEKSKDPTPPFPHPFLTASSLLIIPVLFPDPYHRDSKSCLGWPCRLSVQQGIVVLW